MKLEGIYKGLKRIGYEVLLNERGFEALLGHGNKDRLFNRIDEDIDLAVFLHHVNWANSHNLQGYVFINIKPSTLVKYYREIASSLKGKVVLEIREDFITDQELETLRRIRDDYKLLLSLDDVGKGASNIDRIKALRPNFIKIEIKLFDNVRILFGFVSLLKEIHNCHLIAEKVENEQLFRMVRGAGIELWQGFYEKELEVQGCKIPVAG